MKYSFMSFSSIAFSLEETLKLAARLGYDGIEPRIAVKHAHGVELERTPAERREIAAQARRHGVAIACIGATGMYADPEKCAAALEETKQALQLAADVGSPCVRIFGGHLGAGISREAAIEQVAAALGSLADLAASLGVTLVMETHDDWTNPHHVAAVMQRVNHPSIAVNWDMMHTVRTGGATMRQAFDLLRPWIRHVHIHDGTMDTTKLDFRPFGEGEYDQETVFRSLLGMPYNGYLSGEWLRWEPGEIHLPRELQRMRRFEARLTLDVAPVSA